MLSNTPVSVTDLADDGSAGALRSAIVAANADTGTSTDTIDLGPGTFVLTQGELLVTNTDHTLIIDGQGSTGSGASVIEMSQSVLDRVFQIDSGVTVILENLEITGGTAEDDYSGGTDYAEGGGILNEGNLTLDNVAVVNNKAEATTAGGSAYGGGILTLGPLAIIGSTPGASLIEGNSALGFAGTNGDNSGDGGFAEGGGIYGDTGGQVQITGTTISGNLATGGVGAAAGTETDSPGDAYGGGIYSVYSTAAPTTLINNDTISNNTATGGAGGAGSAGYDGGAGGFGSGGGIAIEPGYSGEIVTGVPVQVSNSTIWGNSAVGGTGGAAGQGASSAGGSDGAFGGGVANLIEGTRLFNDTIFDNTATGGSGSGGGGGLGDGSIGMLIVSSTFAQNTAQSSSSTSSQGGGIDNANDSDTALQIENTLVASNTAGQGPDLYGDADNPTNDLINSAAGSNITGGTSGNITAPTNLDLATALANNGGTTETLALLTGSAAIGAGSVSDATSAGLTTDQRGLPRTKTVSSTTTIDIGAYQTQSATPVTTSTTLTTSTASASVGQSVTFTAVISPAAGVAAAPTGTVQFTVDGNPVVGSPVTVAVVNGVDEATFTTTSLTAGAHIVTAAYSGDTNFGGSTSALLNQVIINPSLFGTTTTVAAAPNPSTLNQSVTFTATVAPVAGASGTPTGTVQFEVDGVKVGSGTLAVVNNVDQATFSTTSLTAGVHSVTAVYSGDTNFNGGLSAALSPVTVTTTYHSAVVSGSTTTTENTALSGLFITPNAADTTVGYFQVTGITGGTLYTAGGATQITNGQFISVAQGAAGLEYIPSTNSVTSGGFTVQESTAASAAGLVGSTTTTGITISGTSGVDLAAAYNLTGISTDGTTFSGGGIDGSGDAVSAAELGTSVSWNAINFPIGTPNTNDAIESLGQTVTLPAGSYSSVSLLAFGTNGNQANQTFIIHYSDGSSDTITQSLSDWHTPQSYAGESIVETTYYRNTSSSGRNEGLFDIYGYTLPVNPAKTVESISLPDNGNVKILSLTTQATVNAPTNLVATSGTSVSLSWTDSTSAVTGYNVYRNTLGSVNAPVLVNSTPLSATATSYVDTTGTYTSPFGGNPYYYTVEAIDGGAVSPPSNEVDATFANSAGSIQVDLSGQYNDVGITVPGTDVTTGGLDRANHTLSSTFIGGYQYWNTLQYNMGPAGQNDVVQAAGQTIPLPSGTYTAVNFLATSTNGSQANETFTVTYTDGTTQTFTQNLSDWASPQNYTGETPVLEDSERNNGGGGTDGGEFYTYGYSFALNSAKPIASITLPNDKDIDILSMDMVTSAPFNLIGITKDGTTVATNAGIDGQGDTLSESELGSSVAWNGFDFTLGSQNVSNVIEGEGQTIAMTEGSYNSIGLLAIATNGNQTNQTFTVNYTDGSTQTYTQSMSDWGSPQNYPGESQAVTMGYRNDAAGQKDDGLFVAYGYTITVNPAKTVESITLPDNGNIKVLSIATKLTVSAPSGLAASPTSSGSVSLSWTAPTTGTVTGYDVYRSVVGSGAAPTLLNSTPVTITHYTDSTAVAGNVYSYTVKALDGASISPASAAATATASNSGLTAQVDLAGDYNVTGITPNGTGFAGGGIDGQGNALSETLIGTSQSWNGINFSIAPTGASNVIQATGQSIALPHGTYSTIELLATGVNGNQANQTFTVNYTDGTTQTITQSLSDWHTPQNYAGESVAVSSGYRNTSSGGTNNGTFDVYGYSFTVNSAKTIASITLPNNKNVDVLSIQVVSPAIPTGLTVAASSSTQAALSWTAASATVAGYNIYRGTTTGGESSTPINSTPITGTSYVDATALPGNTYYYVVKAIVGSAVNGVSTEAHLTMPLSSSTTPVDLSTQYNLTGIAANGATFSGGLDGQGNDLSETELGTSDNFVGVVYNIGPVGANDVVQANGQTIGLPATSYSTVSLLATAVNGDQTSQKFTINYTDGTSQTFTQSVSDWFTPQEYAGESAVLSMYRNTSVGGENGTFYLYSYSFAVNTNKSVASITLPNDKNVEVLAISAVNVTAAPPLAHASGDAPSTFTFGGAAVPVDSALTISSSDTVLTRATVTISAGTLQSGDMLNFNNQNGIAGSYNAASGELTLTGSASVADYEQALDSVTFSSTSTNVTPRSLTIVAADNSQASNPVSETVDVAPVVIPSGTISTFSISGATSVPVDSTLTINSYNATNPSSPTLSGASVTISAGSLQTGDTLNFTNQNNILGSYSGGVLTLSGSASLADYQAALRSITFSSSNSSTTPRLLSIAVTDSNSVRSNLGSESVNVTA